MFIDFKMKTISRASWLLGLAFFGILQIALMILATKLIQQITSNGWGFIPTLILYITFFATGIPAAFLTTKRCYTIGFPRWFSLLGILFICPVLVIVIGVYATFFDRRFDEVVIVLLFLTLVCFVTLLAMPDKRAIKQ